ncbi:MAG: hypothetical protein D4S01_01420 [Dehalococcoidia bacterium]|nr:MAG: hypothetical protein D4S01_01420 [Dehalococcoidia bacterium]
MKTLKLMVAVLLIMGCGFSAMAEGLLIPNTDGDNLGRTDKKFGTVFANIWSNLTSTIYGTNGVFYSVDIETGTIESAALTDKAEWATLVTPTITTNVNGGTNVVLFTVTDVAGTAIAYNSSFRFWITDDVDGSVAAVAGEVAISGGVELQQVVDKGDYWVVTTNNLNTLTATITDTPNETTFLHVQAPCGRVTTVACNFTSP